MKSLKHFSQAAAIAMSLSAVAAYADSNPWLPVQNADFADYTGQTSNGSFGTAYFPASATVNPVDWSVSSGSQVFGPRLFVDANNATTGSYIDPVYHIDAAPLPGVFIQDDGAGSFVQTFQQTITGLKVGQTYQLSFYQASGQDIHFSGSTIVEWAVGLGTSALQITYGNHGQVGPGDSTYSMPDTSGSAVRTPTMTTPSQGSTPWELVTVDLTADATTDVLSFLAWGDNGSTANEPPIAFLTGINSNEPPPSVPEPSALALFGLGLLGVGGSSLLRGRRGRRTA